MDDIGIGGLVLGDNLFLILVGFVLFVFVAMFSVVHTSQMIGCMSTVLAPVKRLG